ncbi:hypothetical protein H0W32_00100, partial [Patescibacteria group bacterium]|nr:hypothetical protein [Patescibacteria group bacterium]
MKGSKRKKIFIFCVTFLLIVSIFSVPHALHASFFSDLKNSSQNAVSSTFSAFGKGVTDVGSVPVDATKLTVQQTASVFSAVSNFFSNLFKKEEAVIVLPPPPVPVVPQPKTTIPAVQNTPVTSYIPPRPVSQPSPAPLPVPTTKYITVQSNSNVNLDSIYARLLALESRPTTSQPSNTNSSSYVTKNFLDTQVDRIYSSLEKSITNVNNTITTIDITQPATLTVAGNTSLSTLTVSGDSTFSSPLTLTSVSTPGDTTNKLYSTSGTLYWNGSPLAVGGGANWGAITGTLSSQTDLQNALDLKLSTTSLPTITTLLGLSTFGSSGATTTSAGNLSVAGNLNFNGSFLQNGSPFVGSQWTTSGSNIYYNGGNVGIGTSTPQQRLTVAGNADVTGRNIFLGSKDNAGVINFKRGSNGNGASSIGYVSSAVEAYNLQFMNSGGGGYFSWYTNSTGSPTERMRLDNNGNFGIGSTTPTEKLVVEGAGATRFIVRDSTGGGTLKFVASGADAFFGNAYNGSVYLQTNNTNQVKIDASGNVGIDNAGTLSNKLEVVGNSLFGSAATANTTLSLNSSSGTGSIIKSFRNSSERWNLIFDSDDSVKYSYIVGGTTPFIITSAGNVGIGTTSPSQKLHVYSSSGTILAQFGNTNGATRLVNGTSYNSIESYTGTLGSYRNLMLETGNGVGLLVNTSGNVGIGTTTPGQMLHVYAGASGASSVNTSSQFVIERNGSTGISLLSPLNSTSAVYFGNPSNNISGAVSYDHTALSMSFKTAGTSNRMIILGNGNVGIGTTSPSQSLTVDGVDASGRFCASVNSRCIDIYPSNGTINSVNTTLFLNRSNANNIVLGVGGGNVGIGTTTPNNKLTIANSSTNILLMDTTDSTASNRFTFTESGVTSGSLQYLNSAFATTNRQNALELFNNKNGPLILYTSATERLRIDGSGNVGIGTTSPQGKLEVYTSGSDGGFRVRHNGAGNSEWFSVGNGVAGLVKFNAAGGQTQVAASGDLGARMNIGSLSSTFIPLAISGVPEQSGDLFRVDTYGTGGNQFVIKSSGNVGVGTTTPSAKLHITGSADAKQLIVQGNSTQTANLQEWQNSNGSVLGYVNSAGSFIIPYLSARHTYGGNGRFDTLSNFSIGGFALKDSSSNDHFRIIQIVSGVIDIETNQSKDLRFMMG